MVQVILTRIDSPEENKINLSGGKVLIGRGSILGCDDKRISRKHGLLQVSDDGSITLVSTHSNPCFYKVQDSALYAVLVKGQTKVLGPGDQFGLLPNSFRYRIGSETCVTMKRKRVLPGWLTDVGADQSPSSVPSCRKRKASRGAGEETNNEGVEARVNQEAPPLLGSPTPTSTVEENEEGRINQEYATVSGSPTPSSTTKENGETRVKEESPTVSGSPTPSSTVEENGVTRVKQEPAGTISPSPPVAEGEESRKAGYEAEYGDAGGSSSSRRDACPYGAACYRRNPGHRAEMSHPGDPDHPLVPECPYGVACYRRNPQHRRDFSHAGPPATPPSNVNYYNCNVTYSVCPKCQNTTCIDLTKDEPEL